MKKFSLWFASLLLITGLLTAMPVFAEDSTYPEPNWGYMQDLATYVNDVSNTDDITVSYDQAADAHTFTYVGSGTLTGWTFPWASEGEDYEIVSESGNSITLRFINAEHGIPYLNAVVDFSTGDKTSAAQAKESATQTGSSSISAQTSSAASSQSNTQAASRSSEQQSATQPNHRSETAYWIAGAVVVVVAAAVAAAIVYARHKRKG